MKACGRRLRETASAKRVPAGLEGMAEGVAQGQRSVAAGPQIRRRVLGVREMDKWEEGRSACPLYAPYNSEL